MKASEIIKALTEYDPDEEVTVFMAGEADDLEIYIDQFEGEKKVLIEGEINEVKKDYWNDQLFIDAEVIPL